MYHNLAKRIHRDEKGFTLVELLVVIVILGILAAIVVFSVRGVGDKGKVSACNTDANMLITAEESNFAQNGVWATSQLALQTAHFITRTSTNYDVVAPIAPSVTYSLTRTDAACPAAPLIPA